MNEAKKMSLQAVSKVAIAAQATDVQIFLGTTEFGFDAKGNFAGQTVNFFAGYSVSPVVAKQLSDALISALDQYEKSFGKIPVDPKMQMNTGTFGNA